MITANAIGVIADLRNDVKRPWGWLAVVGIWLSLFWGASIFAETKGLAPADIRLVIDVSGSMKKNDPANLRKPSIELLLQLLPADTHAGVWIFGQSVNMLIPYKKVDDAWKSLALNALEGVHSRGLFTHIGAALETASKPTVGLKGADIILLTDGVVDVSKAPGENQQAWQKIMDDTVPNLKQKNIRVHAIALSADADQHTLEKIARETGGRFASVNTADDLMKVFLDVFDQTLATQKLPIQDNRFLVDSRVDELTALLFRKADASPTVLIGPDDKSIQFEHKPETVRWVKTAEYDLITLKKPLAGEWRIKADVAPESRVTIVSQMTLSVEPVALHVLLNESLSIDYGLFDKDQLIDDKNLLNLIEHKLEIQLKTGEAEKAEMLVPASSPKVIEQSRYQLKLPHLTQEAEYELTLTLDGKTFMRQFKHHFRVTAPFSARIEQDNLNGTQVTYLRVKSYLSAISSKDVEMTASVTYPDEKESHPLVISLTEKNEWQAHLDFHKSGVYDVQVQVNPIKGKLDELYKLPLVHYTLGETVHEAIAESSVAASSEASHSVASTPDKPKKKSKKITKEKPFLQPWMIYSLLGFINLLILAAAGLALKKWVFNKPKAVKIETVAPTKEEEPEAPPPSMLEMEEPKTEDDIPPMEELESDGIANAFDDEDLSPEVVEQLQGDEGVGLDEDTKAAIRLAQGLDQEPEAMDEAIRALMGDLNASKKS